jgi:peptidoglycan/xylan/chitin deacetylase (PgdA/CDA1 family)
MVRESVVESKMNSSKKAVYCITFDDGRIELYEIGKLLGSVGIRATFYVIPSLIGTSGYMGLSHLYDLREKGHLIANHGWEHKFWKRGTCGFEEIKNDIVRASEWLCSNGFEGGSRYWAIAGGTSQWQPDGIMLLNNVVDQIRLSLGNDEIKERADILFTDYFDDANGASCCVENAIKNKRKIVSGFHFSGLTDFEKHLKYVVSVVDKSEVDICLMNEI